MKQLLSFLLTVFLASQLAAQEFGISVSKIDNNITINDNEGNENPILATLRSKHKTSLAYGIVIQKKLELHKFSYRFGLEFLTQQNNLMFLIRTYDLESQVKTIDLSFSASVNYTFYKNNNFAIYQNIGGFLGHSQHESFSIYRYYPYPYETVKHTDQDIKVGYFAGIFGGIDLGVGLRYHFGSLELHYIPHYNTIRRTGEDDSDNEIDVGYNEKFSQIRIKMCFFFPSK